MTTGYRYYKKGYNIPQNVIFCTKCVNSNQRPRLTFDENGVCSACNYADFKNQKIDWVQRKKELEQLCEKHRRKDGSFDCIVPSSGGKDSGLVAHMLKNQFGMNPLTVTWAPHLYTEIGFQNHQNHIHVGNLANILITPPGLVHRKLTKLAFENLGEPFLPFIFGQNNMPLQIAEKYKISLMFFGENSEVEYGGNMADAYIPTKDIPASTNQIFSGMPPEKFLELGIKKNDLTPYLAPKKTALQKIGLEVHYFGYYHKWIPQECYYYCVENTGFKANSVRSEGTYSKYASLDDKLDGFHYYLMFIKFGFGRATSDAAHEVRDQHIIREEAVSLVGKFDGEFPSKHYETFLEYCGIEKNQFWEVVDSWRADHVWKKVSGEWCLRHKVDKTGIDD